MGSACCTHQEEHKHSTLRGLGRTFLLGLLIPAFIFSLVPSASAWIDPPYNVSQNAGSSIYPDAAREPGVNPDIHLVWEDNSDGLDKVWYSKWNQATGTWVAPQAIAPGILPAIGADAAGKGHVVYRLGNDIMHTTQTSKNGPWSIPEIIGDTLEVAVFPEVAAKPDGSIIHAMWERQGSGNQKDVLHRQHDQTETWSPPANVSNSSGRSEKPHMVGDAAGNTHAVWADNSTGTMEIYYSKRNGSWTTPAIVRATTGASNNPAVTADPAGNPHVMWDEDLGGGNHDILYSYWTGSAWTGPQNITANAADSIEPVISVDGSGNLNAAWLEWYADRGWTIRYISHRNGEWSTIVPVPHPTANVGPPDMIVDGNGCVHIFWHQGSPGAEEIKHTKNCDWTAPTTSVVTDPTEPNGTNSYYITDPNITFSTDEPVLTLETEYQWDSTSDSGWQTYTDPIAAPEGEHTLYYRSVDIAGNTETIKSSPVLVDTTPPSAFSLLSPPSGTWTSNTSPTLSWNASSDGGSNGSGLAKYQLYVDGALSRDDIPSTSLTTTPGSALGAAEHTWYVLAVDRAGMSQASTPPAWNLGVDSTGPSAPVVTDDGQFSGSSSSLHAGWSATDSQSGIGEYLYAIGTGTGSEAQRTNVSGWTSAGTATEITRTGLSLQNGQTYYISVKAVNGAGITGPIGASDGIRVDTAGPNGFSALSPGGASTNRTPTFDWSDTLDSVSGLDHYELWVGGLPRASIAAGTSLYAYPTELPDGNYSWFVRAYDAVGNWTNSSSLNYIVDNTGPSTPIVTDDGLYTNSATQLHAIWSASDLLSGIAEYQYSIVDQNGATVRAWTSTGLTASVTATSISPSLNNGSTYTFRVKVRDNVGNWSAEGSSNGITADLVAPGAFDLLSPASLTWVTSGPTLSWQAAVDALSGIARYDVYIDGVFNRSFTAATGTLSGVGDGNRTWYVRAVDNAGNATQSTSTWTLRVDGTPPAAFNLSSPANGVWTTNGSPTFAWVGTNDGTGSGLVSYKVVVDGATRQTVGPAQTSATVLGIADGTHTWRVEATDLVGNVRSSATWTYPVDASAPPTPTVTDGGAYTNSATSLTASWSGNDPHSPITLWEYSIGTSPGATNVKGWTSNNTGTNVTANLAVTEGTTYYFNVRSTNSTGLVSPVGSSNGILSDRTSPSAPTLTSPTGGSWTAPTTTFRWSASSDTSGIAQYQVAVSGPGGTQTSTVPGTSTQVTLSGLAGGGGYTWTVTAIDGAGNTMISGTGSFSVDNGPPAAFSLKAPATGSWAKGSITFEWFPSSDVGGIGLSKYQLYVDGVLTRDNISAAGASTAVSLSDGSHTWYVVAADGAGNTTKSTETWTLNIDNTGPANFDLLSPANNNWTNIKRPAFAWGGTSDSGRGLQGYELWINSGSLKITGIPPGTTTATPTTDLGEADHTWYVYAVDGMGNTRRSVSQWTVRVDSVSPAAFSLNSPANGAWTHSGPTLAWSASSDSRSGLSEYELYIDNSSPNRDAISPTPTSICPTGAGTCRSSVPSAPLADGVHTWWVVARDNAGNFRQSDSRTINVDRTPPAAFDLAAPANNSFTSNTSPTLSWNSSSDTAGSGLAKYQLYVDGVLNRDNIPASSNSTTPLGSLSDGVHAWYVVAVDNVGYATKSTSTFNLGIDAGPPANVSTFTAVAGDGQVTLSWINPTVDFAGVKIYRKDGAYPTGVGDGTLVYDGTGALKIDTGLTNGTTYYYAAFAYDGAGNYASCTGGDASCSGTATPIAPPPPTTSPPPGGVIKGCPLDPDDPTDAEGWDPPCNICIQWTPNSKAARYQVLDANTGDVMAEVGAASTQASFPGRSDKAYKYELKIFDANGKSWKTNQVDITTPKKTISHSVTGPFGGYVEIHCKEAAVEVPVNSFAGTQDFTIGNTDPPAPPPSGQLAAGPVFEFGPDGQTFAEEAPATVTLIYDPVPDPNKLIVAWYNTSSGKWMPITTGKKIDTAKNTISVETTHFTHFGVFHGSLPSTGRDSFWVLTAGLTLILFSGFLVVLTRLRMGK